MEILNLETSQPKGLFKSIFICIGALAKNFCTFLKLGKISFLIAISQTLITWGILKAAGLGAAGTNEIISVCLGLFAGLAIFIFAYWKNLLAYIAVSYLAKDVLENKEIKSPKDYISYILPYGNDYVRFLLVLCLIWILYIFAFFLLGFGLSYLLKGVPLAIIYIISITIAAIIVTIPLNCGLSFASVFFAYEDKSKSFKIISNAVKKAYKYPFSVFFYFVILAVIYNIIRLPITMYIKSSDWQYYSPFMLDSKAMTTFLIFTFVSSVYINYMFLADAFIKTGGYFELIKKK